MLTLSQTTGYAIRALSCLHHSGDELVLAKEIAERTGIPKPYLSKILHALRKTGLVTAKRGYRGGVALSRPASEISLLEIAESVEGDRRRHVCLLGMVECSDLCEEAHQCPVHDFWVDERSRIEAKLRAITLAQMAQFWSAAATEIQPRRVRGREAAKSRQ
jgi:Rrf2 family iron-sulfur cluster assembly transcriptional regulator